MPKFKGVPVELGDTTYTVPPLGLRALQELLPRIQSAPVNADGLPTDYELVLDMAIAALHRNYPDLTREEVDDCLDVLNAKALALALFGKGTGFVTASPDGPEGNARPAPSPGG
jgi:hypothetical protein